MSKDLLECIHFVKQQRVQLPSYESGEGYWASTEKRRIAIEKMVKAIGDELPKVKITERSDLARVSIAGIRASSTMGIDGALANWVAAAYRHLDKQAAGRS